MAKQFKFDGLIKQAEQQKAQAEKQVQTSDSFIKNNLIIKEEFKYLIPPMLDEELSKLEENIIAEGCRDPLVVWKSGENFILIDGHNRYAICQKHQIDFNVLLMEFENSEQVNDWMVSNQLGKRNVTDETKSYLRGMQYNREKKKLGENQYTIERIGQNVPALSTAEKLAQIHKVSEKTIKRDEKYAEAINKIVGEDKSLKWSILNKKILLPKGNVMNLADETETITLQIGQLLKDGLSFGQALNQAKPKIEKQKNESPQKEYLKKLRADILACLDEAIKQNSQEPIEELREILAEFEKAITDN